MSLQRQDIKENTKCCGQRITKGNNSNRIGPGPGPKYFSILNVHLGDINVFAESDEIPLLPVHVIKEKPKC